MTEGFLEIQEAEQTVHRINPKKSTLGHIFKSLKTKDKKKNAEKQPEKHDTLPR